jgi:hypothetical protein
MRFTAAPPSSVRIGNTWYSYNQLDPAAGQVQMWADTTEAIRNVAEGKFSAAGNRIVESLKSLARDKTFLQGMGEIVKAAEADDQGWKAVGQFGAGMAASFVPRPWRDALAATDPYIRDMSVRERDGKALTYAKRAAQRGTPLPANMPPPKRDIWGRPVQKGDVPGSDWVWRMVVPVRTQQANDEMNVERLIFNYNRAREDDRQEWPGLPGDTVTVGGITREMNEAEYDAFLVRRGQIVLDMLSRKRLNYATPGYVDMQIVLTAFERATARARNEYLSGKLSDTAYAADLRREIRESRK